MRSISYQPAAAAAAFAEDEVIVSPRDSAILMLDVQLLHRSPLQHHCTCDNTITVNAKMLTLMEQQLYIISLRLCKTYKRQNKEKLKTADVISRYFSCHQYLSTNSCHKRWPDFTMVSWHYLTQRDWSVRCLPAVVWLTENEVDTLHWSSYYN